MVGRRGGVGSTPSQKSSQSTHEMKFKFTRVMQFYIKCSATLTRRFKVYWLRCGATLESAVTLNHMTLN